MAKIIPVYSSDSERGVPAQDVFSRLLKERIIIFNSDVNEDSAAIITAQLLLLKSDSDKPIYIYINSPGGSIYSMFPIIDVMNTCKTVVTIAWGIAASAAAVILSCGTKGHRYAFPNSCVMIHQAVMQTGGKFGDVHTTVKQVERLQNTILEMLSKNTGKSRKEVDDAIHYDYYMTAQEAQSFGMVDHIIGATTVF